MAAADAPPPVPPRIPANNFASSGPYGYPNSTMGMGSTPWSTVSPYQNFYGSSPYSSYNSPYYGNSASSLSSFVPEAARGPFETIESVVHAVSSISMLLDSTYNALIASVRSVFAVGEQLSRARSQMGQLYAALAFTRFVSWFRNHFAWALGCKTTPDLIWTNVQNAGHDPKKRPSQWPLLLYVAFLVGAPYLTWRLVKGSDSSEEGRAAWSKGQGDHFVAKAEYDFEATQPDELSFKAGDTLNLAPKELQSSSRGWLLGSRVGTEETGLVPANRIKILGRKTS